MLDPLVTALCNAGVKRLFGIPGGGCNLDLIEIAESAGIEFVLARNETAAVIMAAVTADLEDGIGVALTGRGPGLANSINGIAHASLDRSPVLIISDGLDRGQQSWVSHQTFDQAALVQPVTKAQQRIDGPFGVEAIDALIRLARRPPRGPVWIELCPPDSAGEFTEVSAVPAVPAAPPANVIPASLEAAHRLIRSAQRPVVAAGLDSLQRQVAPMLKRLVERLQCPLLSTYKARGVIDSDHPGFIGLLTGGSLEEQCLNRADLVVSVGVDPVELIPRPWSTDAPVLELATHRYANTYFDPEAVLHGPLVNSLEKLCDWCVRSHWSDGEISTIRRTMDRCLDPESGSLLNARSVVEIVQEKFAPSCRLTVDAGAHMISAMAYCRSRQPYDVLISNGLATMAFALPAAIAASLHDRDRGVIALTGDGGLLMCLGELATAVQQRCNLTVIVLNDGALSLIDIKQQQRRLQSLGVHWPEVDFAHIMEGVGGAAYRAASINEYLLALEQVAGGDSPALIDVTIDASGYRRQLEALRG